MATKPAPGLRRPGAACHLRHGVGSGFEMALLEVNDLVKTFRRGAREVRAIDRFSLAVDEGEFVAIVGPSGCGKSTFLHILGGFEPYESGSMRLNDAPIRGPGPDRGMLFQEFALYPWRSVIGNVGWALEVQGRKRAERVAVAEKYLKMVGLSAFRDAYPAELSGGMKQRVALARVLAFEPRILLMDEPFGALDAQTRELMQEELNAIWQQTRKTVLFVTHDIDEAIYLADRVIVFTARPGRLKDEIPIGLERPRHIDVRKSTEYMTYRNRVWDSLREEVLKAREEFR
jgi:NitT/TauT family transport system ATP-binding protein